MELVKNMLRMSAAIVVAVMLIAAIGAVGFVWLWIEGTSGRAAETFTNPLAIWNIFLMAYSASIYSLYVSVPLSVVVCGMYGVGYYVKSKLRK